jgi:Helix-turn-helix domain
MRHDTRSAARKLKKSRSTLSAWRQQGRGPAYFRDGTVVYYEDADLEAFQTARQTRHRSTAEYSRRAKPLSTQP